ncbi:MAG: AAA family ATPase, partial [Paracoccaceae bacterium]
LDEIEKAHAETFDLLLGILGEGRLTDARGRLVDFRMTLIVMTSIIGSADPRAVGFGRGTVADATGKLRDHFRPEFFNRIDRVVPFSPLTPADILRVVDLELGKVGQRTGIVRRGLTLEVSVAAREELARLGYSERFGARPLKRVIQKALQDPLAELILAGRVADGETVAVTAGPDGLLLGDYAPGAAPSEGATVH